MVHDINEVKVHGRLGRDAEVKHFDSGRCITEFSIALYAGKDKPPAWVDVKQWGDSNSAPFAPVKGQRVYVSGRLTAETWKDRATGADRSKIVINAETVSDAPLDGRPVAPNAQPAQQRTAAAAPQGQPTAAANYDAF